MYSVTDDAKAPGFPIQRSTDQRVLSPPRSLSQSATSFIASRCQGIHQMPFFCLRASHATRTNGTPMIPTHGTSTQHAMPLPPEHPSVSPGAAIRISRHFLPDVLKSTSIARCFVATLRVGSDRQKVCNLPQTSGVPDRPRDNRQCPPG